MPLSIYVILPISIVSNNYLHNEPLSLLLLFHLGFFAYNKHYSIVQEEAVIFLTYYSRLFPTTYPTNRRTYRWMSWFLCSPLVSCGVISATVVKG
jgi:hypothetical protein